MCYRDWSIFSSFIHYRHCYLRLIFLPFEVDGLSLEVAIEGEYFGFRHGGADVRLEQSSQSFEGDRVGRPHSKPAELDFVDLTEAQQASKAVRELDAIEFTVPGDQDTVDIHI